MIEKYLLILSFLFTNALFSQEPADKYFLSDYKWNDDPHAFACPDSLLNESEVNLMINRVVEFTYSGDDFIEHDLYHRIIYLGSDEAIEQNNRIYIPLANDELLEISKARAINPDGEVIELSQDDINVAKDDDGNTTYYYAFKGLVKGSIIEFFDIQTYPADYSGVRLIIQNDIIQLNYTFQLISPWNFIFAYKGFNGFGEMSKDTTNNNENHLIKQFAYIPKYKFENQSFYRINAMQVVYKLDENLNYYEKNYINYDYTANRFILNNVPSSKKEVKVVSKWIKESGADKEKTKESKIRTLEVYLKKNYPIIDVVSEELEDLIYVDENKITNAKGFIKAISIACDAFNIKYEVVMTTNRATQLFDPKFESYNYLELYLMYFPSLDVYLDPNDSYGSLGIVTPYYQDNYGVFFRKFGSGKSMIGRSKINFIKGSTAEQSHHDMLMDIKMSEDFSSLEVNLESISTGQFAAGIQPYYDFLDPEEIELANKDQVTWIAESVDVMDVNVSNAGFSQLGVNPFIINSTFTVSEFVSKVRDNYLIKIGLLIGPQTEMYQDFSRTLPVDTDFRKYYHRELNFTIPEGYKIGNLDDLNMNKSATDENGEYALFSSSYILDGDILRITCDEYYEKVHYEVDEYEDYRSIINSAANFNKIVLFLEKM
jgi:hypothetical protein